MIRLPHNETAIGTPVSWAAGHSVPRLDAAGWRRSMTMPAVGSDVREEARWRETVDQAPALLYLLACNRREAYTLGVADGRETIARLQARLSGRQPAPHRQWPALAWLQVMPNREPAERRMQRLTRWPHAWHRHLVESSNPDWTDLDDVLFHRPRDTRRPVPETGLVAASCHDVHRAFAEACAARQDIAALPARHQWEGAPANWWYAQVKSAPWLVSVFACKRRDAFRIEACPGRVLEATMARLLGYNRARELGGARFSPARWVWLEPHATEAEARARLQTLQQWPAAWIRRFVSTANPEWCALDGLLAGYHPEEREAVSMPMV